MAVTHLCFNPAVRNASKGSFVLQPARYSHLYFFCFPRTMVVKRKETCVGQRPRRASAGLGGRGGFNSRRRHVTPRTRLFSDHRSVLEIQLTSRWDRGGQITTKSGWMTTPNAPTHDDLTIRIRPSHAHTQAEGYYCLCVTLEHCPRR